MSAICGITGNYARWSNADSHLSAMLEGLAFRAPDEMATWIDPAENAMFGFRWLRTQPGERCPGIATVRDDALAMTCDGQVFEDNAAHGTASLLEQFDTHGSRGWHDVDAQFALAIWDRERRHLTLARDPLGVRFLYYWRSSDGVIFASEIKALLRHPAVTRGHDEIAFLQFLTFLNVPGPRTLFAGIRRVPSGCTVEITPDGAVSERRYWDLLDDPVGEQDDESFYVARTRELHHAAVRRRRVSGPLGALLSGGNDSSANVSLLARNGNGPLHTFTVGHAEFEGDAKFNDLYYARKVAEQAGTKHHDALISTDEFLSIIPQTVDAQDDLVSEPSSVFLYQALRMAKDEGVRVVITGEANDELCCGHGGMAQIREGYYGRWSRLMRLPRIVRKVAALSAPLISPRLDDILRRAATDSEYFWSYEIAWPESELERIVPRDLLEQCKGELPSSIVARNRVRVNASDHGSRDYLNYMIYSMMQDNYFGNLMLSKLDLLSSRLSIESRCPYTSPAYAHWVYNVPAKFKWRDGWVKHFFKKSIEGVLPVRHHIQDQAGVPDPRSGTVRWPAGRLGAPRSP